MRLTANHFNLESAQQLLTLFDSQAELFRRQIGDRSGDGADLAADWLVAVWLNADCPFHDSGSLRKSLRSFPLHPHIRAIPTI